MGAVRTLWTMICKNHAAQQQSGTSVREFASSASFTKGVLPPHARGTLDVLFFHFKKCCLQLTEVSWCRV